MMKHLKLLSAFVILFASFSITSCSEAEPIDPAIVIPVPNPNPDPDPTEPAVFKVDFDGQTYTATTTMVYISGGSIILNAIKGNGDSFGMILDGASEGTYAANENIVAYTEGGEEFGWWGIHPTDPNANTGSVIITDINTENNTISGTFAYTGYWSDTDDGTVAPKEFTNGVFTNIPYVSDSPTGDSFYAKVNGTEFVDNDILVLEIGAGTSEYYGIAGRNAADAAITVGIRTNAPVGTYPITGNTTTDVVQLNYALSDVAFGTQALVGTVTLSEKTATRLKGTFSGTVVIEGVNYVITGGTFDVAY